MAKKWYDGNKIAEVTEIPEELFKYDDLMRQKPNFDKSKKNKREKENKKKFKYR